MENKAFFTGEHSTVLINMDHVVYAKSEGPQGGKLILFMVNGAELELSEGNANMFRKQWRSYSEDDRIQS